MLCKYLNFPTVCSCFKALSCQNTGIRMKTFRVGWERHNLTHFLLRPLRGSRHDPDTVEPRRQPHRLAGCSRVQGDWSWKTQTTSEKLKWGTEKTIGNAFTHVETLTVGCDVFNLLPHSILEVTQVCCHIN